MKVFIDTPEKVAQRAALHYVSLLRQKPDATLGLATGSTPIGLYNELTRLYEAGFISFAKVHTFNLDEYIGLPGTHDQSYRYFMDKHLFDRVDIQKANTQVPSGLGDSDKVAAEYEKLIQLSGGIDLQLLGIGHDGHIGFNEPGTPFGSPTHAVDLEEMSIQANARFFQSVDEVPRRAVTMGVRTVMNARSIILIALGEDKADIVNQTINGPVCEAVPASVLQLHPFVEVYLDKDAASKL